MAAYDLKPLDDSIAMFQALAYAASAAYWSREATVDLDRYARNSAAATDPLLAAATLMASYARAAIADLDARLTALEADRGG